MAEIPKMTTKRSSEKWKIYKIDVKAKKYREKSVKHTHWNLSFSHTRILTHNACALTGVRLCAHLRDGCQISRGSISPGCLALLWITMRIGPCAWGSITVIRCGGTPISVSVHYSLWWCACTLISVSVYIPVLPPLIRAKAPVRGNLTLSGAGAL